MDNLKPLSPFVEVIRATKHDWPALAEFYARQFSERTRLNDQPLWLWEFLEQPEGQRKVPFFLLKADGRIEGGIGYIKFEMQVGDEAHAAIHPVNYFVNPAYKGLAALRLFRTVLQEGRTVIGSYVSGDARRLFGKSGFADLAQNVHSYHLGLRRTPQTNARGRLLLTVRRVVEAMIFSFVRISNTTVTYRIEDEPTTEFLEVAGRWLPHGIGVRKTSDYLRWRYANSPILNCCYLWQLDRGVPISLAVIHFDPTERSAVLLDIVTAEFDAVRCAGVILATIRYARAQGAETFTTHCMSTALENVLRRVGCGRVTSDLGFMFYCPDAEVRGILGDATRWHFMLGDTDRY